MWELVNQKHVGTGQIYDLDAATSVRMLNTTATNADLFMINVLSLFDIRFDEWGKKRK